ncbi:diguanylate cyclase [Oscillatoriales cyanobacterium USR001]|nr:diguanylate cyclase [Oscillatoriales cyanobacterium USR001]
MFPAWVTTFSVSLLLLLIRQLGGLQELELASFDRTLRLMADRLPDSRLLIVSITEADIQALGRLPISDRLMAQAIATLQKYQPKAIGLDIYRDVPQEPGHKELQTQLQASNIIAITKFNDAETMGVPPPPGVPAERVGFNDLVLDADGVIRRNLLFISKPDKTTFYSFSFQLALLYLKDVVKPQNNLTNPNQIVWGKAKFEPLESNSGGYTNLDDQGYQILLQYRSPRNVARQVSFHNLLKGEFNPSWIKGKIVLIGTTAPSSRDVFLTPYSPMEKQNAKMPGVIIHAHNLSQILSAVLDGEKLFWFWPEWVEFLWTTGWASLGGVLAWRIQHPLKLGLFSVMGIGCLLGASFWIFVESGWVPMVETVSALVLGTICVRAYKQLDNAFYDSLTGLPNRALFINRVARAIQNAKNSNYNFFAVFFLDLDRFKVINDSLGHLAGDRLLIALVERLRYCLSLDDLVARVGGGDFAILIENIYDVSIATSVAEKIQEALISPFNLSGQEIFMTVSIGIAMYGGQGDISSKDKQPEDMLRNAHTAMYRAKALGMGRCEVFHRAMHAHVMERLQLETDLRMAVKSQEFLLNYQPFVSLATGKIVGFEALIRWQHPKRGLVFPDKFIPVAEETGLILSMGQWVLQEAIGQLRLWQKQFQFDEPLIMSVNLSARQFSQPNLVEQIQEILQQAGVPAECLKLEITESVVMDDVESAIAVLNRMKALNVKLGIDDFGTGYSSLSYLSRFPTDTLKVDKSFVGRMEFEAENEVEKKGKSRLIKGENMAIVRTIVMLAHALGMDVIAEGVETAEQLALLRSLGCEYGQGYFFARPLPSDRATALIAANPKW